MCPCVLVMWSYISYSFKKTCSTWITEQHPSSLHNIITITDVAEKNSQNLPLNVISTTGYNQYVSGTVTAWLSGCNLSKNPVSVKVGVTLSHCVPTALTAGPIVLPAGQIHTWHCDQSNLGVKKITVDSLGQPITQMPLIPVARSR